jgi:hypothetical protein
MGVVGFKSASNRKARGWDVSVCPSRNEEEEFVFEKIGSLMAVSIR